MLESVVHGEVCELSLLFALKQCSVRKNVISEGLVDVQNLKFEKRSMLQEVTAEGSTTVIKEMFRSCKRH